MSMDIFGLLDEILGHCDSGFVLNLHCPGFIVVEVSREIQRVTDGRVISNGCSTV
jgi:hypothetical protein